MDLSQLLFGVFSGDMGALSVLFVLMLPFVLVWSLIVWAKDKVTNNKQKGP